MLHGPVQYDVTAVLTSLTLQASLTTFLMLVSLLLLLMSLASPLLIMSFQLLMSLLLLLMSFSASGGPNAAVIPASAVHGAAGFPSVA
jgi:hypothetical protein